MQLVTWGWRGGNDGRDEMRRRRLRREFFFMLETTRIRGINLLIGKRHFDNSDELVLILCSSDKPDSGLLIFELGSEWWFGGKFCSSQGFFSCPYLFFFLFLFFNF